MRRFSRSKDKTHAPYVQWLRERGWHFIDTSPLPKFLDGVAVKGGRVVFVEFKGGRCAAERKPRPHQEALHALLRRFGAEVAVVALDADLAQFERHA